ncbi:MAG: GIY-YIG nuclease family protein [Pseudomonadota bacterium]
MCLYYTYVLQSERDGNFYVGFTKNLKLRFEAHSNGQVESTKGRRPLILIYYEACLSQDDATRREKYLKSYHGRMFIKRRLKSYLTG